MLMQRYGIRHCAAWGLALLLTNALLKLTRKPVGVGVKLLTTRPRTAMAALVPVIEVVTVSVAVSVCVPAVFMVTTKVPVPLVKVELPTGDNGSVLVNLTVPA